MEKWRESVQTLTIEVVKATGEVVTLERIEGREALWRIFSAMLAGGFSLRAGGENWVQMTATVVVSEPHEKVEWEMPK